MNRHSLFIGAAAAILLAGQADGASVNATLANPSVRLWYEATGRLSDNIAPPRSFALWNTIIGGGEAEESANDVLFTVEVRTEGLQNIAQPLTLAATGEKGKILARRVLRGVVTSEAGKMTAALWVRDVGCAGPVIFTAHLGASRQAVRLDFNCGE